MSNGEMLGRIEAVLAETHCFGTPARLCCLKVCRCERAARLIVAALREPTEAMLDAWREDCFPDSEPRGPEVWQLMIDAELGAKR